MPILTPSDFVDRYAVSLAFQNGEQKLLDCIDRYENSYLNKLFGVELLASFSGTIPDDFKNPFFIEYECNQYESKGVKDMLLGFIWFHFCFDTPSQPTSVGNTTPNIEAGILMDSTVGNGYFNQSAATFKAIQFKCIKENTALFNGQYLRFKTWF
jgi:hypothetical protein